MLPEYKVLCLQSKTRLDFEAVTCDATLLTPFILDTSTFNLENKVNVSDLSLHSLFQLARAVGVAVGCRSGGRLASTLVATKTVFITFSATCSDLKTSFY